MCGAQVWPIDIKLFPWNTSVSRRCLHVTSEYSRTLSTDIVNSLGNNKENYLTGARRAGAPRVRRSFKSTFHSAR